VQVNLGIFFPKCRFGNILVTTRNPQLRCYAEEDGGAKVADMGPEDAKCLLMKVSQAEKRSENEKLAALIVKNLHHFALAISQAGAYILRCSSLKKYQELYQEHHDQLLQTMEVQGQDQYGLAVYTTWRLSYEKLGSSARTLLQIFSFLHHEGIMEEIFKEAVSPPKRLGNKVGRQEE